MIIGTLVVIYYECNYEQSKEIQIFNLNNQNSELALVKRLSVL
jgi:hypothetical protein